MLTEILFLIAGLGLLVLGGNWLLRSSVDLASRLGMPKMIIGLTIVSFATSAPELIVSINAALSGASGIAIGNVIGSNIANLGLVLGITILITPLAVSKSFFKMDWVYLMASTVLIILFILFDSEISRFEGVLLVAFLIVFVLNLLRNRKTMHLGEAHKTHDQEKWITIIFYLLIGGAGLWLGSDLLVGAARNIATELNVPESVIGLTVVAIGTSVPELAASIIAAVKGEKSISLGNLIGSNIFNILSVLGITALILPVPVEDERFLTNDIWWMLGFAAALLPLAFLGKKFVFQRFAGILLVATYILFVVLAF